MSLLNEELEAYTDHATYMTQIKWALNEMKRVLLGDNLKGETGRLRAVGLLEKAKDRADQNPSYAYYLMQWITNGDANILKSIVLEPLGYLHDHVLDFAAFALLTDIYPFKKSGKEGGRG